MKDLERFYVLTGGPGSGKTAVIEALHRAGFARTVEAGRSIIQDQMAIGGRALPWQDPAFFAELMLSWEMRSYHMAEQSAGPVFFDRGVVDVIGYLRLRGRPVSRHMEQAAAWFRYNRRVFIAPPWKEIFAQDCERKQDFDEAVRTYEAMVAAYTERGYELAELPRVSVEDRMRFLLQNIGIQR
ncbi:MAG TPA: AAA family ATPase [Terriglobales bacterium]|nr:AAA family ATPase [Terriglobales bacterium]